MSAAEMTGAQRERIIAALYKYDGDAVRPGTGIGATEVAELILRAHFDFARCFCPACVVSRAFLEAPSTEREET